MHYQVTPHAEAKLVRCTTGALFDAIVDIRDGSPSCGRWYGTELTAENRSMLYVPEGVAHGFQTLLDGTEVFYQMSEFFHPESARGIRWDDPSFAISWPLPGPILGENDLDYPLWTPPSNLTGQ